MYGFPAWMGFATIASFVMLAVGNAWAFYKTLKKIKDIEGCCNSGATAAATATAAMTALAKVKQVLDVAKTVDEAKDLVKKNLDNDPPAPLPAPTAPTLTKAP